MTYPLFFCFLEFFPCLLGFEDGVPVAVPDAEPDAAAELDPDADASVL